MCSGQGGNEDQESDTNCLSFMEIKHNPIRWRHREHEIMSVMPLEFRLAAISEYPRIEEIVIESFEPITWFKRLDKRVGPLNGRDWCTRWQSRMQQVFETEIVLVGKSSREMVAMSSGTLDRQDALAYIDLLAVDRRFQGCGYGREMLRGMMRHMKYLGARYVHLECLVDNETANALYRSEGFEEVARHIRWFRRDLEGIADDQ